MAMTLGELLAKKKAGMTKEQPTATPPAESTGGIKISAASEQAALAASIKMTMDACAPKVSTPAPQQKRELGTTESCGERVPMDQPPQGAADQEWEWFDALHSFSCDLCVVLDPRDETKAWLGLFTQPLRPPLLLMQLPLANRETKHNPF